MVRAVCVLVLAGCTVPLVSTERAPVRWVRHGREGSYEKLGVPLEGYTCGEQYARAVSGVPEAEELVASCRRANDVYGAGMLGFIVFPVAGLVTWGVSDHGTLHDFAAPVGVGAGAISFLIGFAMAVHGGSQLKAAVRAYNAAIQ